MTNDFARVARPYSKRMVPVKRNGVSRSATKGVFYFVCVCVCVHTQLCPGGASSRCKREKNTQRATRDP
jgi:hypothetical protein